MKIILPSFRTVGFIALLFGLQASHSAAEDVTWTGGGETGAWSDDANWGGSSIDASNTLIFTGTNGTSNFNDTPDEQAYTLQFDGNAGDFTLSGNSITFGGNLTSARGTQTINLDLLLTAARTISVSAGTVQLNGNILQKTAGNFDITKSGAGTLELNGENTFTRYLLHSGGKLLLGSDHALGTSTLRIIATGTTFEAGQGDRVIANNVRQSGHSSAEGSHSLEFGGTYTPEATRTDLTNNIVGEGKTLTISGSVLLANADNAIWNLIANAGAHTVVSGKISNREGVAQNHLWLAGSGTKTLSGDNTYNGTTVLQGGTLRLGSDAALGGSTLDIATASGVLQAAGGDRQLANAVLQQYNSSVSGSHSLSFLETWTHHSTTSRTLTNDLDEGRVLALGSLILSTNSAATFTINGSGTTQIDNGVSSSSASKLAYQGTGVLILGGESDYTGTTSVTGGRLYVNGTHTGAGSYTVGSGGMLGGTGVIKTANDAGVTIASGGKLAPGNSPGELTFALGEGVLDISGGVAASASQALVFRLGSISDSVKLTTGTLNIGNNVLEFDDFIFSDIAGFAPGVYMLFDANDPIDGILGVNLSGMVAGYDAHLGFANEGSALVLTVIPEPSIALLFLSGGLVWVFRRRYGRK